MQCDTSEREQAHQIDIAQIIILTLIEVILKVTYKVVFIHLKHEAAINYWSSYVLPHLLQLLYYLQESGPTAVGVVGAFFL